jgi:hypothetical protein
MKSIDKDSGKGEMDEFYALMQAFLNLGRYTAKFPSEYRPYPIYLSLLLW